MYDVPLIRIICYFLNIALSYSLYTGKPINREYADVAPTEEIFYKEPSAYDKLLVMLGSSSKSVADAYKRRYTSL